MPIKPLKPCNKAGCSTLTREKYCEKHQKESRQQYDQMRGSSSERGYDHRWRKARKRFLQLHPWCVECKKDNLLIEATVVDHIIPHKGDMVLFWDEKNWQSLCKRHHDRKTAIEDGGFGNKG